LAAKHGRGTEVEESRYNGRRVYEFDFGDRCCDRGNEHALYSEDGKLICEFGGFAGHVTSGSCDFGKVVYRRTLIQSKRRVLP
jgi:hypothetical protein